MKVSIFIPTHNPRFLPRLIESIKVQTYADFEVVIVPNGGCSLGEIPAMDGRIRVVEYPLGKSQNIGEIKSFACANCSGEILAEVDHDDELTPDCVESVIAAFEDPSVDFAYSNCAEIGHDGLPYCYVGADWVYRNLGELKECIAFDPSPASFSKIWWACNHIRCWRKRFYHSIGGHDHSLSVLDDQDLLSRTYIHGKVHHINKCLYVYYNHPGNTCKGEKNALIQELCLELHDKYIERLVFKWCDLNGLRKIDLGAAFSKPDGYEGVDRVGTGADIEFDLEQSGWPFEDGSVGVFRLHDVIEHLRDPIRTMSELYRCLAPNGWALILVPSTDGRGAFQAADHVSFWNSNSFFYYTRPEQAKYIGTPVKFVKNRIKNFYPSDWHKLHEIVYCACHMHKYDPTCRTPGGTEW